MKSNQHGSGITVKRLIELLQNEDPNKELYFGGLTYFKIKDRGDLVQVEFNQSVYPDSDDKIRIENN